MKRLRDLFESTDEKQKLYKKIKRTGDSITNHVRRGATIKSHHSLTLLDRYNELKHHTINKHRDVWDKYCEDHGSHPSHDGYDLFA